MAALRMLCKECPMSFSSLKAGTTIEISTLELSCLTSFVRIRNGKYEQVPGGHPYLSAAMSRFSFQQRRMSRSQCLVKTDRTALTFIEKPFVLATTRLHYFIG